MPELPEVETIRRDLSRLIQNKKIVKVAVYKAKIIKNLSAEEFCRRLKGDVFAGISRRGKFLIFNLKSGDSLLIHMGMSGSLRYGPEEAKYTRVRFNLNNGFKLCYADPRMFGKIKLLPTATLPQQAELWKLGPEPLSKQLTLKVFRELLSRHKGMIKPLLLNQNFIAGIGNIYAAESLFLAGIRPDRKANRLTAKEIKRLYLALKKVLQKAVDYRGTSIVDFVDTKGRKGGFQLVLKVYNRKGEPCYRCKRPIRRVVLGQRGTYYCVRCQR